MFVGLLLWDYQKLTTVFALAPDSFVIKDQSYGLLLKKSR